jgi:hypothetical protein
MAFFSLMMLHLKTHLVFQLQSFISSTFYLRCIKLATQSCSSELVRLELTLALSYIYKQCIILELICQTFTQNFIMCSLPLGTKDRQT